MSDLDLALRLHETFRAYVSAEAEATRTFVDYKFGRAREQQVHARQAATRAALDAHIAAMNEVAR